MKKIFFLLLFLVSCSSYEEVFEEGHEESVFLVLESWLPGVEETGETEEEEEELMELFINPLTGIGFVEERSFYPVAVVINNIPAALPQSGIAEADIIYEVLAEGGITRLIAIFTYSSAEKIGPIRSTRSYFAHIANEWNSPIVHHGGSPSGYDAIRRAGLVTIDGMHLESSYFWRDAERRRRGLLEHSSYTNWDNIISFMETRGGLSNEVLTWDGVYFSSYGSYDKNAVEEVTINFSHSHSAVFVLDGEKFVRYQRGLPHIDENTEEQLTAVNLIIQRAAHRNIIGDEEGRIDVNLSSSGSGYLVTYRGYKNITWEYTENGTIWQTEDGEYITLLPGNTWISIIGQNSEVVFK